MAVALLLPLCLSYFFLQAAAQNATVAQDLTTIQILDRYGYRTVSYFVDGGLAVVDGDVIYGTEADLLAVEFNGTFPSHELQHQAKRSLSVFENSAWKWPGGAIKYQYESQAIENTYGAAVQKSIDDCTAAVTCLKFEKLAGFAGTNRPAETVVIRQSQDPLACSASWIGFRLGQSMDMKLTAGWVDGR